MARMLCWAAALICSLVTVYGEYCEVRVRVDVFEQVNKISKKIKEAKAVPNARGENIALGKPAYQSSVIYGGAPGRVVDGKMTPIFNQRSCSHTGKHQNPSWWVDLGKEYFVQSVVIQNREDCCSDRLRNVVISVGDDIKGGDMPLCAEFGDAFQAGEVKELTCETPIKGRYVKVHTKLNNYLSLCEVQVYGYPA